LYSGQPTHVVLLDQQDKLSNVVNARGRSVRSGDVLALVVDDGSGLGGLNHDAMSNGSTGNGLLVRDWYVIITGEVFSLRGNSKGTTRWRIRGEERRGSLTGKSVLLGVVVVVRDSSDGEVSLSKERKGGDWASDQSGGERGVGDGTNELAPVVVEKRYDGRGCQGESRSGAGSRREGEGKEPKRKGLRGSKE
jgi:hypothetical protein